MTVIVYIIIYVNETNTLHELWYLQGDSGGPMTQDGTVYGIASWVASGCLSNFPSTYSRVGAFYEWVCDETNNQGNGC